MSSALRVMGLSEKQHFQNGPLVLGLDDTIERRGEGKIQARGIYRDPVRSSDSHFVNAMGNSRGASPNSSPIAPASCCYRCSRGFLPALWWSLPTAPSPPCNCCQTGRHGDDRLPASLVFASMHVCFVPHRRQKGVMGRPRLVGSRLPSLQQILLRRSTAWQLLNVNHWYGGGQRFVEVASGTAIRCHTGLPPVPIRWVLVRDPKGQFETRALLCTQLDRQPGQILQWFLWRWQVEVTFQEVRAHLGVETQRQWSHLAIARTTPVLLGLFSLVTLLAHRLARARELPVRQAACYRKTQPTFSHAIAVLREQLWHPSNFFTSHSDRPVITIPRLLFSGFCHAACYAA